MRVGGELEGSEALSGRSRDRRGRRVGTAVRDFCQQEPNRCLHAKSASLPGCSAQRALRDELRAGTYALHKLERQKDREVGQRANGQ